jgi:serine/threonine protein kinase
VNTTVFSETPRNALPPGFRLHWYRIRRVLGVGGFGITYLASDENLHVDVAIKEYLPGDLSSRDSDASVVPMSGGHEDAYRWGLERFMTEARTLARFKHPNIVEVRSVFEANKTAYMVMAYETGDSLTDFIAREGPLDEDRLKAIVLPILDGLSQVHAAGFIHRDIKPSNIYLRRNGQPVLLDFGAARQAVGERTRTLTSVLSPGYAPFEQYFSNADKQGPWTDIYGIGATLYHAVTGRAPMPAVDRSEGVLSGGGDGLKAVGVAAVGRYSPAFLAAIDHALAFRPEDRPQSVADWREELCAPAPAAPAPEPLPAPESVTVLAREPPRSTSELPQIHSDDPRRSARIATHPPEAPRSKGGMIAAITVAVALIVLGGGAYLFRDRLTGSQKDTAPVAKSQAPAPEPVAAQPLEPAAEPPRVDQELADREARVAALIEEAQQAYAAGRLVGTTGDSAAEAYGAVLAIDAGNESARSGLERIASDLTGTAKEALAAGEYEPAASAVTALQTLDPAAPALAELQAGLEQLKERRSQDLEVYQLLAAANADLEAGRILEPEGDNALEKFIRIEELRPGMGAVKKGFIDIGNYLLEAADRASKEERFDDAYGYLDIAKSILPDREEIDSARQYVDNRKVTYDLKQGRSSQSQ